LGHFHAKPQSRKRKIFAPLRLCVTQKKVTTEASRSVGIQQRQQKSDVLMNAAFFQTPLFV
jgi:hypothetical protein